MNKNQKTQKKILTRPKNQEKSVARLILAHPLLQKKCFLARPYKRPLYLVQLV